MLAFLTALDHDLFRLINAHNNSFFDSFFSVITWLGSGWVVTPLLIFLAFRKVSRNRRFSFIFFSALFMIISGVINSQIKHAVHRPRPLTYFNECAKCDTFVIREARAFGVHTVGPKLYHDSFPSGHTNTAFSAATLVAFAFKGPYWWALPMAFAVGYSRIYLGVHFPADVFAGGLLGIIIMLMGLSFIKWFDRRGTKRHDE
jgi:undecaprenyl-diphosphatase